MKKVVALSIVALLCAAPLSDSVSESRRPSTRGVKCPPIIADKKDGTFIARPASKKNGYQCFNAARDAVRSGFLAAPAISSFNFNGWWRLRLTKVEDSCGRYHNGGGLVLFTQVVQEGNSVFADFCPSLGRLVGYKSAGSASMSRSATVREHNGPLACTGGEVELTEQLILKRVVDGGQAFEAQLIRVRRCPGAEEGDRHCATTLSGVAFPETHRIWPSVIKNTSKLEEGCAVALDRCAQCHANLSEEPKLP